MLHASAARFDMIGHLKLFCNFFFETKQGFNGDFMSHVSTHLNFRNSVEEFYVCKTLSDKTLIIFFLLLKLVWRATTGAFGFGTSSGSALPQPQACSGPV